jgi:signal transduction histidine kinase
MTALISNLQNLDLLSVGIAVAGMIILGFVTFFNNLKSVSNRVFLCLAITASAWGIVNYSSYQVHSTELSFWLLKFIMFFAVWSALFIFTLSYVFPSETVKLSQYYKWILVPVTAITAFLTLTPLVFNKIAEVSTDGRITRIINGPGIFLFGALITFLNIGGVILIIRKIVGADKVQRKPLQIVLFGIVLMLLLIMAFNFILPAFFSNTRFIPLGAVFLFPFIALTSYAILRHNFLGVKVITTEILTFFLSVAILYEVVFSESLTIRVLRLGIFFLVLGISILLIRSVRKEVQQRERLQKLTEELQAANDKLKALDKLRAEFLSFASHQVKSPMAVVKGFAQLIADGSYGAVPEEVKGTALKIKDAADRLVALVNNLLDMRKIEEGKMDFNFTQVDIVAVLKSMTEGYKIVGQNKGLAVSLETSVESLKIKADEQKIRQVIQNMIDNAIKYTDTRSVGFGQAGFVKVSLKDEGQKIVITVEDNGRGISAELQKKLFGQFVRDEKTKNEIQGTGLGLYIAKKIIEAHHGEIWATSEGEGKGSTFNIRLSK